MKHQINTLLVLGLFLIVPFFTNTSQAQTWRDYSDFITFSMDEATKDPDQVQALLLFGDDKSISQFKKKYKKFNKLKVLQIIGYDCSDLGEILTSIPSIESLRLNRCELTEVPSFVLKMTQLVDIDLAGNNLTAFPYDLGSLTNLKRLTLGSGLFGGNQVTTIDNRIAQLKQLESLALFQNPLTSLATEIGQLQALQVLDLSQCRLSEIPTSIGQLTSLKDLALGYNKLKSWPTEIGQLTRLEALTCIQDSLVFDFTILSQLTNIKSLGVSIDGMTTLPTIFKTLNNLQELYLGNCGSLEAEAVVDTILSMNKVEELYLFQNEFSQAEKTFITEELSDLFVSL